MKNFYIGKAVCLAVIVLAMYTFFGVVHFHNDAWWAFPTYIVCALAGLISLVSLLGESSP